MSNMNSHVKNVYKTAVIASGVLVLTACEEAKIDGAVYESLGQCVADINMTRSECEKNFTLAKKQHATVAPKFESASQCEAEFGANKCEKSGQLSSNGTSMFMPMMMGYMMGSMMSGRGYGFAQPLYKTRRDPGTFRTADNRSAGTRTGQTKLSKSAASRPTPKMSRRSRGGFGSTARRFGSAAT
ncbi:MAG: DUF1190 domain-containing protein [Pseudomonadota bacterium]|nr:DUF1190 domain-containing protein [Pseudomonadota bacterium]MEC9078109.1 DUF1190 domain-containing protein [Pseudomonadota bacterium]